jgi:ADP-ribose pyrophosphatase YjhB (NUDIX family)
LTQSQKERVARLVRLPIGRQLLAGAVRLIVPRHRVGVALVVFDAEDRVLMLRHVFHPTTPWGVPGGWLDRREDPAACALRELGEETGLAARLGAAVFLSFEAVPPHVAVAYAADVIPGPLKLSAEILEAGWFPPDDLPGPLLPFVQAAIDAAVARRRTRPAVGELLR